MARRRNKDRLPFHDDIVRWRGEGRSLSEISQLIHQHHGEDLNRHVVNRYCAEHGIGMPVEDEPEPPVQAADDKQGQGASLGEMADDAAGSEVPDTVLAESDVSVGTEPSEHVPVPPELSPQSQTLKAADLPPVVPATSVPSSPPGTLAGHIPLVSPPASVPGCDEGLFASDEADEPLTDPVQDLGLTAGLSPQAIGHIRRLKALWDEGALTEVEFRGAADRLLGLMPRPEPSTASEPSPANLPEPVIEAALASANEEQVPTPPAGQPELFPAAEPCLEPPDNVAAPELPQPTSANVEAGCPEVSEGDSALASPPVSALTLLTFDEAFPAGVIRWQPPSPPFPRLPRPSVWTPDLPVLTFPQQGDEWTLRDACEGTFILGATGSGKTTGSGRTLAKSFLDLHFGGLVLCVKPDERQLWERYAAETGRSAHLCVVESGGRFRFNFLDYEAQRCHPGRDWIENVTNLFASLMSLYSRGQKNRLGDDFWVHAGNQLLRNALRILALCRNRLQLADIVHLISEAPQTLAEVKLGSWRETEHFGPFLEEAERTDQKAGGTPEMEQARRYWLKEFPALADKTRSTLVTSLSALVDGLYSSDIHELFCRDTTLTPEAVQDGAIIIVDLPLKTRDFTGLLAQAIWKYFFQKAVERRSEPPDACRRPVFLWIDEAQFLYSDYDSLFQSTARSSGCATVYLTQNIANFYGIHGNREKIDGFLGNLNTKIFHANNDPASNRWAAEQVGKSTQYRASVTSQNPPPPSSWQQVLASWTRSGSSSVSTSSHVDYAVQPAEFAKLRMGGTHNRCQVDAYFTKSGARFSNGKHYFKTTFLQEF